MSPLLQSAFGFHFASHIGGVRSLASNHFIDRQREREPFHRSVGGSVECTVCTLQLQLREGRISQKVTVDSVCSFRLWREAAGRWLNYEGRTRSKTASMARSSKCSQPLPRETTGGIQKRCVFGMGSPSRTESHAQPLLTVGDHSNMAPRSSSGADGVSNSKNL